MTQYIATIVVLDSFVNLVRGLMRASANNKDCIDSWSNIKITLKITIYTFNAKCQAIVYVFVE